MAHRVRVAEKDEVALPHLLDQPRELEPVDEQERRPKFPEMVEPFSELHRVLKNE